MRPSYIIVISMPCSPCFAGAVAQAAQERVDNASSVHRCGWQQAEITNSSDSINKLVKILPEPFPRKLGEADSPLADIGSVKDLSPMLPYELAERDEVRRFEK